LVSLNRLQPVNEKNLGAALRQLRLARGLNQTELGKCLGVSLQQVQKYESGANRISASTLYLAAEVLKVDVAAFYAGLRKSAARPTGAPPRNPLVLIIPLETGARTKRAREAELIDIVTKYQAIVSAPERTLARKLISRLSASQVKVKSR